MKIRAKIATQEVLPSIPVHFSHDGQSLKSCEVLELKQGEEKEVLEANVEEGFVKVIFPYLSGERLFRKDEVELLR